jgi:hypothetical protein
MSDQSRRAASFDISASLVEEALRLPEGCEIVGCHWNFEKDAIRLFITSSEFAEVMPGARVPHLSPLIRSTRDEAGLETIEWQWKPEKSA